MGMPTKDEQDLRARARSAIRTQLLPSRRPDQILDVPGDGAVCVVCGKRLAPEAMAVDLEFAGAGARTPTLNYPLHVRCFAAWEFARADTQNQLSSQPGMARTV